MFDFPWFYFLTKLITNASKNNNRVKPCLINDNKGNFILNLFIDKKRKAQSKLRFSEII